MTREEREEALDALKISMPLIAVTQEDFNNYIQTLNKIMDWLEQEPCNDCISRKQAIEQIEKTVFCYTYQAKQIIEQLPPVTPAEKMGQWKRVSMDKYVQHAMAYYRCSECGKDIIGTHNYCPSCGAKMGGEQDEADN